MDYTKQMKRDLLKSWEFDAPSDERDIEEDTKQNDITQAQKEFLFLCAVTKLRGNIDVYKKSISLTYEFDSKDDAIEIASYVKKFTDGEVFFVFDGTKDENTFKIQIKDSFANGLLKSMSLSHFEGEKFICDDGISYLRSTLEDGRFLWYFKGVLYASAKVLFPDESYPNYCLQMSFSDMAYSEKIAEILKQLDVRMQLFERKSSVVLQSRDSSDIADILAIGGASGSVLELNNIIAQREIDNDFNRQSNFYMANYQKTVDGAKKYIEAIEKLESKGALHHADEKLKAVAKARKEYGDASMHELAEILGMSKTSLARYLSKLVAMAEEE